MNAKLFRYTLYMTLMSVSGVLWAVALRQNSQAALSILFLLAGLQLSVLLMCKRSLINVILPDLNVLKKMGVPYVPIAYQPGRYRIDARVCGVATHLVLLPPVLMWLACQFPQTIEIGGLEVLSYTAPNMNLMLASFITLAIGSLALPTWFHATRAAVIYAEGSEKKRYLYRGFVDVLDRRGGLALYQDARKGRFHTAESAAGEACYWATH